MEDTNIFKKVLTINRLIAKINLDYMLDNAPQEPLQMLLDGKLIKLDVQTLRLLALALWGNARHLAEPLQWVNDPEYGELIVQYLNKATEYQEVEIPTDLFRKKNFYQVMSAFLYTPYPAHPFIREKLDNLQTQGRFN